MMKKQCPVLKNLHFSFRTFKIMIMTILVGSLKRGFSECPSCHSTYTHTRTQHTHTTCGPSPLPHLGSRHAVARPRPPR
jgi:hypothetical protein